MSTAADVWPDRMNPTDALFWTMDKIPELRSTIGALLILDGVPDRERIAAELLRISAALPRMYQRVVEVPGGLAPPEWLDDRQFDLDYHLRHVMVPPPGGLAELLAELSPLYATSLDRDRPLWEAYLAGGLMGGRGAVFFKMHHCLVDGVGGSRLFGELLSSGAAANPPRPLPQPRKRSTSTAALLWRAIGYNIGEAAQFGTDVTAAAIGALTHPAAVLSEIRRWTQSAFGFGQELTTMRAESPLHQHRSLSRQLTTFDLSLAEIDAARAALGATNNDIILTIVAGAMHRWHSSRGFDVRQLRALVPVNLRDANESSAGNRLALLAVALPTGEPNPLRRLRIIQERMGHVKGDRRASLYPIVARIILTLPLVVAEQVVRQQTQRTNFVCTNVPGPRQTCYLAGQRIERMYPYAPLVGDHPVAIALYSYGDRVCVGLDVDPLAMSDLPHFLDALRESAAEVLSLRPDQVRPLRRAPRLLTQSRRSSRHRH